MKFNYIKDNFGSILEGPLLLKPKVFDDERGFFFESWNSKIFNKLVKENINFVQDNHSKSKLNVLRGLHYQIPPNDQGKLVRCISGKIFDVLVDLRKNSKSFLSWAGIYLNSKNYEQIWIPSGFAHGFLTISETAEIIYKTTQFYSKEHERSICWNDPKLKIRWPLKNSYPKLSPKDQDASSIDSSSSEDFFSN